MCVCVSVSNEKSVSKHKLVNQAQPRTRHQIGKTMTYYK